MFFFHHLNWFNILPRGEQHLLSGSPGTAWDLSVIIMLCGTIWCEVLGIWACAVRRLNESHFDLPLQDDVLSNYPSTRPKVRTIMFCMVKDFPLISCQHHDEWDDVRSCLLKKSQRFGLDPLSFGVGGLSNRDKRNQRRGAESRWGPRWPFPYSICPALLNIGLLRFLWGWALSTVQR